MRLPAATRRPLAAFAVGLALLATGCSSSTTAAPNTTDSAAQSSAGVPATGSQVDVATFAAAIEDSQVVVLDVRTPAEFASGHLPGSINMDVQSATFLDQLETLDKTATYAVYCRSGNRSQIALDAMVDAGFESAFGLAGGITDWTAAGGDVVLD